MSVSKLVKQHEIWKYYQSTSRCTNKLHMPQLGL